MTPKQDEHKEKHTKAIMIELLETSIKENTFFFNCMKKDTYAQRNKNENVHRHLFRN